MRGAPEGDYADHLVIAQRGDLQSPKQAAWFAGLTAEARVAAEVESHDAALAMARAGSGIAYLAAFRAEAEGQQGGDLVRLATPADAPGNGIWSVVHRDNRKIARFRTVIDHIRDIMRRLDNGVVARPDSALANGTPDEMQT